MKTYQTQLINKTLRNVKNTIAIASGKGGVGKSTISVNLAVALAQQGYRIGLLDADIYGPSVPVMMGIDTSVEISDNHYQPVLAHGVQTMSIGYVAQLRQALMWRGPMLAKALIQLVDATQWDALDILLMDLPPGTGDIQLSLVQKIPLTGALVVSTPQPVATLDADKAIQLFRRMQVPVLGLIDNMAGHQCSACGHEEAIFGEEGLAALGARYDIPLLGSLPLVAELRIGGDEGCPSASSEESVLYKPWQQLARRVVEALEERPVLI